MDSWEILTFWWRNWADSCEEHPEQDQEDEHEEEDDLARLNLRFASLFTVRLDLFG